jgi:hypothetical protein
MVLGHALNNPAVIHVQQRQQSGVFGTLMATDTVFIYTMNQAIQGGAWSRYVFPWTCEHFAHLSSTLYIRHGDDVSYVIEEAVNDDGLGFYGVIHWPWLDLGQPGVNKMMHGFDIVGTGTSTIEVGYDQTNLSTFTTAYAIPADTYPGLMIPLAVNAPSLSVKLTYDNGTDTTVDALQLEQNTDHLLLESGDQLLLENKTGQAWKWEAFNLYLQDQRVTS